MYWLELMKISMTFDFDIIGYKIIFSLINIHSFFTNLRIYLLSISFPHALFSWGNVYKTKGNWMNLFFPAITKNLMYQMVFSQSEIKNLCDEILFLKSDKFYISLKSFIQKMK